MAHTSLSDEILRRHDLAIDVARRAGAVLRDGLGRASIEHKGPLELVTEFDRAAERLIVEAVAGAFPADGILAEEGSSKEGEGWRWCIDPLDGTTNFAHGLPHFSVSIGGELDGQLEFGVVYDPMRGELFHARRGQGAFLGDIRLRVASSSELADSLLVTGFPYDLHQNPADNLDLFVRLSRLSRGVRRLGSAALDLAYVAAGRIDAYWELRLMPWDVAAGTLLVREAGGWVTRADGDPDVLRVPCSVAAANRQLHRRLVDALALGE
jgi:myo-inositol-1(or 4)-monophosphatase